MDTRSASCSCGFSATRAFGVSPKTTKGIVTVPLGIVSSPSKVMLKCRSTAMGCENVMRFTPSPYAIEPNPPHTAKVPAAAVRSVTPALELVDDNVAVFAKACVLLSPHDSPRKRATPKRVPAMTALVGGNRRRTSYGWSRRAKPSAGESASVLSDGGKTYKSTTALVMACGIVERRQHKRCSPAADVVASTDTVVTLLYAVTCTPSNAVLQFSKTMPAVKNR
mmetsp:Transcript_37527/g.115903  ORF Transcript_37527/g.115903 Transcript_37527/m.115903 type:complete len:223 (-) Transcript_37527:994-1662(-)